MSKEKCLWCGKLFDIIMASCGTGTTWSLYKCPHCEKLMAVGYSIPTQVENDPEIRILLTRVMGVRALSSTENGIKNITLGESTGRKGGKKK